MTQPTAPLSIPFSLKLLFDEFPKTRLSPECLRDIKKIDVIARQILQSLKLLPQERNKEVLCKQVEELKKLVNFPKQFPRPFSHIRIKPPSEDTLKAMYATAAVLAASQTPQDYEENRDFFLKTFIQFRCCAMHRIDALFSKIKFENKILKNSDPFWKENTDLHKAYLIFYIPVHTWSGIS